MLIDHTYILESLYEYYYFRGRSCLTGYKSRFVLQAGLRLEVRSISQIHPHDQCNADARTLIVNYRSILRASRLDRERRCITRAQNPITALARIKASFKELIVMSKIDTEQAA